MRSIPLLALMLVVLLSLPVTRATAANGAAEAEVRRDFEQILDLWREGRYAELYERTTAGRDGKEQFAKRLASAPRRPACCWEKMQDVRVKMNGDRNAVVHAKLGFEGNVSGTDFVTKGIKLKKEDDVWLISQSDLFSLGDLSKKRARYRYLPKQ